MNILNMEHSQVNNFSSTDLYGLSIRDIIDDGFCTKFSIKNDCGTGEIAIYRPIPGIEVIYNDMNLEYCKKQQNRLKNVIEINYCREGRCECAFENKNYCYMSADDLSICSLERKTHSSSFPTLHYHGITITIDSRGINQAVTKLLEFLDINITDIMRFANSRDFYMVRASETVIHIFSELYTARKNMNEGYMRVKVLELLQVLTGLNFEEEQGKYTYFSKTKRDAIKQIHDFLINHFDKHYTIEELSAKFNMSPTAIKTCFKGIYGAPIYNYMKTYRL